MTQTITRSKSHKQMKSLEVLPAGELEDNINLNNLPKPQLIAMVEMLRNKNIELEQEYKNKIDKNSSLQYIHRVTVEISGIYSYSYSFIPVKSLPFMGTTSLYGHNYGQIFMGTTTNLQEIARKITTIKRKEEKRNNNNNKINNNNNNNNDNNNNNKQ